MVTRGWGRVINISSVNGQKGQFGQTNYYPIGTKVKVLQVQEGEVQTLVAFQLVGTALGDRAPTLWTVCQAVLVTPSSRGRRSPGRAKRAAVAANS